ncbi:hypothetical protein BWQ96_00342 [Gracilariopsis chorda]|uniref:FANCI solenoid 2 domain-containing protein n=1 Tax=Gracilariopsis chorda TaxID=448386 RepID=A0A2V3J8L6_9FLOR|nr:hypothetical protein BWQ96_00342 [Gracilariopsis chorda]|eukprot:PXF50182.1 hypothetical protein BWQ96_00342 [Gracilariopsis chorda]
MSLEGDVDVITGIVHAFESGSSTDATELFLRSLPSATISSVIRSIRSPPSSVSSTRLLRALWSAAPLRPTILTTLAEAVASKFTNADSYLLEEIDFLLVADARDTARGHDVRVKDISTCATAIARHSRDIYSPIHGPILVYCARAASIVNTIQARDVRTKILQFLLMSMQSEQTIAVQAVIALLENEIDIDDEEEKIMMNIVLRFVSTQCTESDLPDVLRAILYSLSKTSSSQKAHVLSWLVFVSIQRSSRDTLTDVINVIDVMVLDSDVVCERIATAFWSVLNYSNRGDAASRKNFRFSPSHIAVLYCILSDASSEGQHEYLYYILERILVDPAISFDISTAASSSSSASDEDFRRKAVFVESIKILAVQNRCQTILEFYESLLWKSKNFQEWGSTMLLELFVWVPESRRSILNVIFGTIVQSETAEHILDAFCTLYERIATTPRSAFVLRECQGVLKEALELISLLPATYDCRILKASVPIFVTCPSLSDSMLIFLRKAASSRSRKYQIIACTGLLTFLSQQVVSDDVVRGCCETLQLMMETTDVTVKSHLIIHLLRFIERKPEYSTRTKSLDEVLLNHFKSMYQRQAKHTKSSESSTNKQIGSTQDENLLDLTNCFGEFCGEYVLKEPVCLLAKFCLSKQCDDKKIQHFMERHIAYLGSHTGGLSDATLHGRSKVPVLPRVKTLCDLLDILLSSASGSVGEQHLSAYGISLIVRDNLEGKTSLHSKSNGEVLKAGSNLLVQFASVAAREASFGLHNSSSQPMLSDAFTFRERLKALKAVEHKTEDDEITRILKKKVCSEILRRLRVDMKDGLLEDPEKFPKRQEVKEMVDVLGSLYTENCSWRLTHLTVPSLSSHLEALDESNHCNGGHSPEKILSVSKKDDDSTQEPRTAGLYHHLLSHVHLPADVRKAIEVRNIQNQGPSLCITIRNAALSVLICLCSYGYIADELQTFSELLAPFADLHVVKSRSAEAKRAETSKDCTPADQWVKTADRVVCILLNIVRLEFANSMSVGLTLTYMELIAFFMQTIRTKREDYFREAGTQVFSAITDILREYSVRHVTVLREMLRLCLQCLDRTAAMDFIRGVLIWLGNSSSLINSQFSRDDVEDEKLNVMDFDADIVAEGVALDTRHSDREKGDDEEPDDTRRSAQEKKDEVEDENHAARKRSPKTEEDKHGATEKQSDPRRFQTLPSLSSESKTITSLCLDETAEVGLVSIVTFLGHCQSVIAHEVQEHRFLTKEEREVVPLLHRVEGCDSVHIASILKDFCSTSFAKLVSPKQQAWPGVLVRKIDYIVLGLIECAEIKLRLVLKAIRRESAGRRLKPLFQDAVCILQNLYDETAESSVFAAENATSRLNKTSQEERLKNTSVEVSQVIRDKMETLDESTLKEWKAVVKGLNKGGTNRAIGKTLGAITKDASADHVHVSHPRKRQRLRSRNSGIDGWLQEERGDDDFADLEDFIVPMDATEM